MKPRTGHMSNGDALKIMSHWLDKTFDHCITDPPYNISKKKGLAGHFHPIINIRGPSAIAGKVRISRF